MNRLVLTVVAACTLILVGYGFGVRQADPHCSPEEVYVLGDNATWECVPLDDVMSWLRKEVTTGPPRDHSSYSQEGLTGR